MPIRSGGSLRATFERARTLCGAGGIENSTWISWPTPAPPEVSSIIPPWFHDGGPRKLLERLDDQAIRAQMRTAIETTHDGWENLYAQAAGADAILIAGVRKDENRQYQGKTLQTVAQMMALEPLDAAFELIRRDRSRVEAVYFMMSEENVRKQIGLPWVSFGSDAVSTSSEPYDGALRPTHPRAYGNFARLLGKYVRDERLVPLAEAIRRLTRYPCDNLGLRDRGRLAEGCYADIVVLDPATIADRATYQEPHQYAVGVRDVVVNGVVTLRDGEFAGALAGRAVYGPGKR